MFTRKGLLILSLFVVLIAGCQPAATDSVAVAPTAAANTATPIPPSPTPVPPSPTPVPPSPTPVPPSPTPVPPTPTPEPPTPTPAPEGTIFGCVSQGWEGRSISRDSTRVQVVPLAVEYTTEAEESTWNAKLDRQLCFKRTVEIGTYSVTAGTLDCGTTTDYCSSDKMEVTIEENQEVEVNLLINPP
jgi:hypothetical protein